MCDDHMPRPDAVAVQDLQLDDTAKGLLSLTRHFMTSFADPASQAWQMAFATAQERWGEIEGPQMAMACLAMLQSVRRIRSAIFRYSNPLCLSCRQYMTPDEADMMSLLQAMRRDRTAASRDHLARLTGGRMDPAVITHALALAKRMGPTPALRPSLIARGSVARTAQPRGEEAPRQTHHALAMLH